MNISLDILIKYILTEKKSVILREGVACFQMFRRRKLAIRFWQDTSSSNELIGYIELTEFSEIWPERKLNNEEQKCVGLRTQHVCIFLILELDRSIKRKPIGIRGNAHTL